MDDWRRRVDKSQYPTSRPTWPPDNRCGDEDYACCPLSAPETVNPNNRCLWYYECIKRLHGGPPNDGVTLFPGK